MSSGIICGAGLKLSIRSLQQLLNDKCDDNENDYGWNKLFCDTSLGALNGLISSIGLVCLAQNECSADMDDKQQMITSYALTGLITGTINGTINEVINTQKQNNDNHDDIQLCNVGKTGFMEMGTNIVTAIGKSTIFKSANHRERRRIDIGKLVNRGHCGYGLQREHIKEHIYSIGYQYYDTIKQHLRMGQRSLIRHGIFSNVLFFNKPKRVNLCQLQLLNHPF